jgi:hypothetical protein
VREDIFELGLAFRSLEKVFEEETKKINLPTAVDTDDSNSETLSPTSQKRNSQDGPRQNLQQEIKRNSQEKLKRNSQEKLKRNSQENQEPATKRYSQEEPKRDSPQEFTKRNSQEELKQSSQEERMDSSWVELRLAKLNSQQELKRKSQKGSKRKSQEEMTQCEPMDLSLPRKILRPVYRHRTALNFVTPLDLSKKNKGEKSSEDDLSQKVILDQQNPSSKEKGNEGSFMDDFPNKELDQLFAIEESSKVNLHDELDLFGENEEGESLKEDLPEKFIPDISNKEEEEEGNKEVDNEPDMFSEEGE